MPNFRYTAVDDLGKRLMGTAAADNEEALADVLRRDGRYLVSASDAKVGGVDLSQIRILERVSKRDVIFFTAQLSTITATGGSLVEGLTDLEAQITKRPMKRVIVALRRDLEGGMSLSAALSRHPKAFNELYVNIVRAGEATGKLDTTLDDLARQLEAQEELMGRIREMATYPIMVVVMMCALGFVLVGFTIPRFLQVYERLGSQITLPLPTRIVMGFSNIVRGYWYLILAAMTTGFIALRMYIQSPAGSITFDRLVLRLPIIGELVRKIVLSRFAHYFGTLHQAGLEVAPSLSLMERLIGNKYLSLQFHRAVDRVMAGDSLSRALLRVGEFPPLVIQMIALGERTGQMTKALGDVRRYFDREVDRTLKRSITLFGPIMLIVLASVFVKARRSLADDGAGVPSAFERRCIPSGCVAPPSNIPDILGRRALPAGRIAALGATMELHHGLLAREAFR